MANRAERRRAAREREKLPTPRMAVVVAQNGNVRHSFLFSLLRLFVYEQAQHGVAPVYVSQRFGSGGLVEARNEATKFALDSTPAEWFFFVDADMGFGYDTAERLIGVADEAIRSTDLSGYPMVGALCFALKQNGEIDGETQALDFRCVPTIYEFREREKDDGTLEVGFLPRTEYPRDAVFPVHATGGACFVAHRSLLEAMRAESGDCWFDRITHPVGPTTFSEDLSFCVRVTGAGFGILVDSGLRTSHDKDGVFLTEDRWDRQQFAASEFDR